MSNKILTKTCSSCGLQKPLTAFLQIAGPEGTTYGNICATCRKENKEKSVAAIDLEEGTKTSTGHKIDQKSKVQTEIDKREERQRVEERYYEEREKEHQKEKVHVQKTQKRAKEEKGRRESFLEKRTYVDTKTQQTIKNSPGEIANREKKIDLTSPFIDTQIAGKIKYEQSSIFQQFKRWLGDTPMTRQAQMAERNKKTPTTPKPAGEPQPADTKPAAEPESAAKKPGASIAGQSLISGSGKETKPADKTASSEYIEKKWGPNSRRP